MPSVRGDRCDAVEFPLASVRPLQVAEGVGEGWGRNRLGEFAVVQDSLSASLSFAGDALEVCSEEGKLTLPLGRR